MLVNIVILSNTNNIRIRFAKPRKLGVKNPRRNEIIKCQLCDCERP